MHPITRTDRGAPATLPAPCRDDGLSSGPGTARAAPSHLPIGNPADRDNLVKRHAAAIAALFLTGGGATYSARQGSLLGQPLFACGIGVAEIVPGYATAAQIGAFLTRRSFLLGDTGQGVGLWYDASTRQTFLDTCLAVPDIELAQWLARLHGQVAIFDLRGGHEIAVSGPPGRSGWFRACKYYRHHSNTDMLPENSLHPEAAHTGDASPQATGRRGAILLGSGSGSGVHARAGAGTTPARGISVPEAGGPPYVGPAITSSAPESRRGAGHPMPGGPAPYPRGAHR